MALDELRIWANGLTSWPIKQALIEGRYSKLIWLRVGATSKTKNCT